MRARLAGLASRLSCAAFFAIAAHAVAAESHAGASGRAADFDAVARIAERVGYESEAAFNRAFKREFGTPPAAWRRAARLTSRASADAAATP